jgi:HAD superfamily hydrolase (TIGR01509 family)
MTQDDSQRTVIAPKAVIFDMDGLIFDTERFAVEAWIAAGRELGYEIGMDAVLATVGLARKETKEVLQKRYGEDFPYETIREVRLKIAADRIRREGPPSKKGIAGLLAYLADRACTMAVATSTDRARVMPMLDAAGFTRYFSGIVCGDQVSRNKPDPEIYLKAADAIRVAPEDCLVLEDSPYGIMAAVAAGMRAIVVPDLIKPEPRIIAMAERVCEDLDAVRTYLENEAMPSAHG